MFRSHADWCPAAPWQELVDPGLRMAGNDALEGIGQVGVRVHVVQAAGADERGDDRPMLAAAVGAGEQRVLAAEGDRADGALVRDEGPKDAGRPERKDGGGTSDRVRARRATRNK